MVRQLSNGDLLIEDRLLAVLMLAPPAVFIGPWGLIFYYSDHSARYRGNIKPSELSRQQVIQANNQQAKTQGPNHTRGYIE